MASPTPRPPEQRKADTLAILAGTEDVWLATAGERVHLVPLTFDWVEPHVVVATPASSLTTRNLERDGRARLAFGDLRDVVVADAVVEQIVALADAPDRLDHYIARHGVDPSTWGDDYVFVVLRVERIQAWREANEIEGRTLLGDGEWVV